MDFLETIYATDRDRLLCGFSGPPASKLLLIYCLLNLTIVNEDHDLPFDLSGNIFVGAEYCYQSQQERNTTLAIQLGHVRINRVSLSGGTANFRHHARARDYARTFLVPREKLAADWRCAQITWWRQLEYCPGHRTLTEMVARIAEDLLCTEMIVLDQLIHVGLLVYESGSVSVATTKPQRVTVPHLSLAT